MGLLSHSVLRSASLFRMRTCSTFTYSPCSVCSPFQKLISSPGTKFLVSMDARTKPGTMSPVTVTEPDTVLTQVSCSCHGIVRILHSLRYILLFDISYARTKILTVIPLNFFSKRFMPMPKLLLQHSLLVLTRTNTLVFCHLSVSRKYIMVSLNCIHEISTF